MIYFKHMENEQPTHSYRPPEIVVHCPNKNCGKLLIKEALLYPGTHFKMKCANCQEIAYINVSNRGQLTVY